MQIKPGKTNPSFKGMNWEILPMCNGEKKWNQCISPVVKANISLALSRTCVLSSNLWTQKNFSSFTIETVSDHELFTKCWLALDGKTVPLIGKCIFIFNKRGDYLCHREYKSVLGCLCISTYSSCYLKLNSSLQGPG